MKWKIIGFFLSTSNFAIKRIFRSVELRSFNFFFLFANSQLRKHVRKVELANLSIEISIRFPSPSPALHLSFCTEKKEHLKIHPPFWITGREYKQGETPGIVGRRANATMSRDALDYPIRNGGCSPRPNRDSSEARAHTHKLHILKRRVWEHTGRSR